MMLRFVAPIYWCSLLTAARLVACSGSARSRLALILPPADRIRMGQSEALHDDCMKATPFDYDFVWDIGCVHEYQLCSAVYSCLAESERKPTRLWFPSFMNRAGEIERLARTLTENSYRLGGLWADCQHWPEVPATMIEFTWTERPPPSFYQKEPESEIQAAIKATEEYVDKTIGKLGLCPYTKSMTRAAIGLESVGVKEGPVKIRHAANVKSSESTSPAAVMAAMFWQGVTELMERPEEEVATLLLVAPSCYDDNFVDYFKTCDQLIEKSATQTFANIGRVWFHPEYDLEIVGYSDGGHTLPLPVVSKFMDQYLAEHPGAAKPDMDDMARAHDKTRWTPHATINLLRGSQLKAAKPNEHNRALIYARNILQMLQVEKAMTEASY